MLTEDQGQCVPIELPLIGGPGDGTTIVRHSKPLPRVCYMTRYHQGVNLYYCEHEYRWDPESRRYRYEGRKA